MASKKEIKRLYRSKDDKILGGVCAGIGEYFEIDPTLVRLLFVGVTLMTGGVPGIVAYIVGWLIIPERL